MPLKLSKIPEFGTNRQLLIATLIVGVIVNIQLTIQHRDISQALGDTDDAMRLVMVRALMHGTGWYDQLITRLQPPVGVWMHWSRLLDGALAAMTSVFHIFLPQEAAENLTRRVWPALWTFPAIGCAIWMARRLAGPAAVLVACLVFATNLQVYEQFIPGRIDHHDVQIVMTLIAAVCAMTQSDRPRWAIVAGISTGLGLAIGIEALPFQALIGASYGVRAAIDTSDAKTARNYGLSLVGATIAFFALATPPSRWALSFCDAEGLNLLAAIVTASAGLIAFSIWGTALSLRVRIGCLVALGVISAGAYLSLHPDCIRGPFAAVDPRLVPIWFNNIEELLSWPNLLRGQFTTAVTTISASVLSVAGAIYLAWRTRKALDPAVLFALAATLMAAAMSEHAFRMQDYVFWLGFPTFCAAITVLGRQYAKGLLIPVGIGAIALSPFAVGTALSKSIEAVQSKAVDSNPRPNRGLCVIKPSYWRLASLPPGIVAGDIDFGPYILAYTRDSVLAAPYHRMSFGIYAEHEAEDGPGAQAEARMRALNVAYVVECPAYVVRGDPDSLQIALQKGETPPWLQLLSKPNEPLQIYRVLPAKTPAPAAKAAVSPSK